MSRSLTFRFLFLLLPLLTGCSYFRNLDSPERLACGNTIVLSGIEGKSRWNSHLATGLAESGLPTGIQVHEWTTGYPALLLVHLCDLERNRREARRLAAEIVSYQDQYPGRPVHLVGHSGGGGVALLTLEALPPDRKVTSVVLIAAAISPKYDLAAPLDKVETGIWNFHSPLDAFLLVAGTTVAGTIDRRHTPSAGAYGFDVSNLSTAQQSKLHQVGYHPKMLTSLHAGGHFGCVGRIFSREYIAPVLMQQ